MQTAHPFSTESHRNDGARLGLWSAAALVVGTIIGTGIFFFVSNVAALLPSPNWVLGVWAAGGLVAVCGALCLAELTSRFPENGGMYIFLRRAFGESVAFEYVWVKFLVMRTGSYSIQMLAFATFACRLAGIDTAGGGPVKVVALIGLGFLTLVNIAGILWGGSLQNLLTALKILCLGGVIFVGLTAPPALPPSAMDISPAAGTMTLGLFFLALIPVMWTFGGWDESPFVAGEIRNPQKNVPVSILAGLGLCCVLFLLANAGYLRVLGLDDFASSGQNTAALFLEHTAGRWAGMILCGILMLSTLGAANGMILTGAWMASVSGHKNPIFFLLSKINPRTGTPVRSLVCSFILGGLAILLMPNPFQLLLYTGFAYWIFAALIPVALWVFRHRSKDTPPPRFRCPLHPIPSLVFFVAATAMAVSVLWSDIPRWFDPSQWRETPPNTLITLAILGLGFVAFHLQKKSPVRTPDEDGSSG